MINIPNYRYCKEHDLIFEYRKNGDGVCHYCYRKAWNHMGCGSVCEEDQKLGKDNLKKAEKKNWLKVFVKGK